MITVISGITVAITPKYKSQLMSPPPQQHELQKELERKQQRQRVQTVKQEV